MPSMIIKNFENVLRTYLSSHFASITLSVPIPRIAAAFFLLNIDPWAKMKTRKVLILLP